MMYFDLHCDSISKAYKEKTSIFTDDFAVKIQSNKFFKREQCFALWLDDELQGEPAFSYCKNLLSFFNEEKNKIKLYNVSPHLTIENGSALGGDLNNIEFFKTKGAIMMSLTWNGENDLASGVNFSAGLKPLGKEAVKEIEKNNIILDVSHLNEEGFRDVLNISHKPFVASHSCCYDICQHRRNLKSWQIKQIIAMGGIIGINFYPAFLGTGKGSVFDKIKQNIELIVSLGGENNVALGSDFDGAKMSKSLRSADDVPVLYSYLKNNGMRKELLEKVFYSNAVSFLTQFNDS